MIQARVGDKFLGYLNCEPERMVGGGSLLNLDGHAYAAPVRTKREYFKWGKEDGAKKRIDDLIARNMPHRAVEVDRWRSYREGDMERTYEFQYAALPEDTAFLLFVRELVEETDR